MNNLLITFIRVFLCETGTGITIGEADIGTERATALELRVVLFLNRQQFLHERRFFLGRNVLSESDEGRRLHHFFFRGWMSFASRTQHR